MSRPVRRRGIRHQLPVRSPLPFHSLRAGTRAAFRSSNDPRTPFLERLVSGDGAQAGLLTDSGTSALRLALELLRSRGLEPVALPTFSCFDVATAAVGAEASVAFYDLDPRTLSPDPNSLESALSAGAVSVVVSPLYGFPVDWGMVTGAAERHGAVVIEDAAQAHGGRWRGERPGRFGDLVVRSFGRGKGWTGGGGGALLARGTEWAEALDERSALPESGTPSELAHLVRAGAQWALGRPSVYGIPRSLPGLGLGETRYRDPWRPAVMARAVAGIAKATEAAAREEVGRRRRNAAHYQGLMVRRGAALEPIESVEGGESGYLRFPLLLPPGPRDPDGEPLSAATRLGIAPSYPQALNDLPAVRALRVVSPGGEASSGRLLARRLVTLPTHGSTTRDERRRALTLLGEEAMARAIERRSRAAETERHDPAGEGAGSRDGDEAGRPPAGASPGSGP